MKTLISKLALGLCLIFAAWSAPVQAQSADLTIQTTEPAPLVNELVQHYARITGVSPKVIHSKTVNPGLAPEADLVLTHDLACLIRAAAQNRLAKVEAKSLKLGVPSEFRDTDFRWFGLSFSGQTMVYKAGTPAPQSLQALGTPQWKGRLLAGDTHFSARTHTMDPGIKTQLACPPQTNDVQALNALVEGKGDLALVNTSSYARFMASHPGLDLEIYKGGSQKEGLPLRMTAAAVLDTAPNKAEAVRFLKWLTGRTAQNILADGNMEYAANPRFRPHTQKAAWGYIIPAPLDPSLNRGEETPEARRRG